MTNEQLIRFFKQVDFRPTECWEWKGLITEQGYGRFSIDSHPVSGHRTSYEHFIGPIPEGLVIDHLCRNRKCVNPYHMEAVTQLVNAERGECPWARSRRNGTCIHGHPKTEENTYIDHKGKRYCQVCRTAANKRKTDKDRVLEMSRRMNG